MSWMQSTYIPPPIFMTGKRHTLSPRRKKLTAAVLAQKIGYLKIQDIVPSGVVDLPTQSLSPHKIIGTKNRLFLLREGTIEIWHTHHDLLVKTLEPGVLFGTMALLGQVMLGTRAISGTGGSVIVEVPPDTVKGWMKANPLVSELIGSRLAEIEVQHY